MTRNYLLNAMRFYRFSMLCPGVLPAWGVMFGVALIGAAGKAAAAYDDDDVFTAHAEVNTLYDSNLFRVSDGAASAVGKKSDTVVEARAGGSIDKTVSRQRFVLEGDVFRPTYLSHRQLDYQGWQGSATWHWQVGSPLSGKLAYEDQHTLSAFEDVLLGQKDLVRQRTTSAEADYALDSHWSVLAAVSSGDQKHDSRGYLDLHQQTAAAGVRLRTGRGSEVKVMADYLDVDYDRDYAIAPLAERGYRQRGLHGNVSWPISGKTTLTANLGIASWRYYGDGDWRQTGTGGFGAIWQASEKTRVSIDYQRDFEAPGQNIGRNVDDNFRLAVQWQATGHTVVDASWRRTLRHVQQVFDYDETTDYLRLGLEYEWHKSWFVSVYGQYQTRDSELPANDYTSAQLGLNLGYRY
ncbi:hypothetical protein IGB42_00463 [Andreprevotia sp. IGB-42]|uniref:hypothetical protein n=1 Tax=Andreprevotia sp. IGB-42 TaxID=2497473 RepID=UPI00135B6F9C|nr:hypothetical protein [Andreprevotia sp. IGB-42]KAF0815382.1 hypothetical protein IGB42_00463 [Andreprevotia sp. IGB-42]